MVTAPLMVLNKSLQAEDIAASRGPHDIFKGLYRMKQYVKNEEMASPYFQPRRAEFDQPYQVAAERTGCSWAEGNLAFMVQLAKCNLACTYCFVGDTDETRGITPSEVWADYWEFMDKTKRTIKPGTLRVSGGEPFLFPEWLATFCDRRAGKYDPYLWVDTNLSIMPPRELLRSFAERRNLSVCGCFKPDQVRRSTQLAIIASLLSHGVSVFLYWPCDSLRVEALLDTLEALEEIRHRLPLRLTPIYIRWHYETVKARLLARVPERDEAIALGDEMRKVWADWCSEHYTPEELWAPSHQV